MHRMARGRVLSSARLQPVRVAEAERLTSSAGASTLRRLVRGRLDSEGIHGVELEVHEIQEDDSYRTYGLALFASSETGLRGFEFQRNLRAPGDPNAPRPPFDAYCVVNESHDVSFGGVEFVSWGEKVLVLRFSEEAAEELSLPSREVSLVLAVSDGDLDVVKRGILDVFSYGPPDRLPAMLGFS